MKEFFIEFFYALGTRLLFFLSCIADLILKSTRSFKNAFENSRLKTKYCFALSLPYIRALKSKWALAWAVFCAVAITAAVLLLNLTADYYLVSYKDVNLGYIRNASLADTTLDTLKSQFPDSPSVQQDLSLIKVSEVQTSNWFVDCFNKNELEAVIVNAADSINYGYSVYIGGERKYVSSSEKITTNAINDYKQDRITLSPDIKSGYDSCDVQLLKEFKIEQECVLAEDIKKENIYNELYDLFEAELPYRIVCLQTEEVTVPYITYYIRSEELYKLSKRTVKNGSNGLKAVQTELIVENGQLISSTIIDEKTIKKAVTKRVEIGSSVTQADAGTSNLVFPLEASTYHLTSGFGMRSDPFTKKPAHHSGLDLGAKMGTEIFAAAGGKVIQASDKKNGYGKCVIIEHYSGFRTLYGHCSELLVNEGDYVMQGELIAKVGSTGRSTGPHLHFSVLIDGSYVDPSLYF